MGSIGEEVRTQAPSRIKEVGPEKSSLKINVRCIYLFSSYIHKCFGPRVLSISIGPPLVYIEKTSTAIIKDKIKIAIIKSRISFLNKIIVLQSPLDSCFCSICLSNTVSETVLLNNYKQTPIFLQKTVLFVQWCTWSCQRSLFIL